MGSIKHLAEPEMRLDDFTLPPHKRQISTRIPEAQSWFEHGLIWSYAFNHAESARSFQKAIDLDPKCAFAYWGLAYASGPNYNKSWNHFDKGDLKRTVEKVRKVVETAVELSATASPVERALIHAVKHRLPEEHDEDYDFGSWNLAYAEAMWTVYSDFKDDADVAALYADALMNLTPWALWDLRTGKPGPGSRALEAKEVLERALKREGGSNHVGLLHLYIHLMEMSAEPERALQAAENLRILAADAGHLAHMPSHLDILIGDYRRAIAANAAALRANDKFVHLRGSGDFYTIYRMHDFHSLIYAAMFAGQYHVALDTTRQMEAAIPRGMLRVMADWLETFFSVRAHVLIRFGKWEEIFALEVPADQELFCVTTATVHYAKGVAWSATGNVENAAAERELFLQAKSRVPDSRINFPNKCTDVLAIAEAMLNGELEYRRGNIPLAFNHLQHSIALDDALTYGEPWAWMQPARHAYAALLMEQNRIEEAAEVYRTDLGLDGKMFRARHHPNNVWALHGYYECAVRLGLEGEARIVGQLLKTAMAFVDVEIKSSCYCRRDGEGCCEMKS